MCSSDLGACQKSGGLFGGLFGGHAQKNGKDGKGDCGNGSSQKGGSKGCGCRTSLLDRLFACNSCGKGGKGGKGDKGDKAGPSPAGEVETPMPPAPVVDPSAFLRTRRPVIQATSYVR